jgi:carbon storage regulator CsrA
MLILKRRTDQTIIFPNCGITVRMLNVNGKIAKVGIEAPDDVSIVRGEAASDYETDIPRKDPAVVLQRLRDQLQEVQSLRDRGFDDRADRLFERVLLELNAMDHTKVRATTTISEARIEYESSSPARVLFVGSPSSEYEDDVQILQRRLSDLALMADCMSVDFLVRAAQVDCIIFDLESCGPHVASRIKELRSSVPTCPSMDSI